MCDCVRISVGVVLLNVHCCLHVILYVHLRSRLYTCVCGIACVLLCTCNIMFAFVRMVGYVCVCCVIACVWLCECNPVLACVIVFKYVCVARYCMCIVV